MTTKKDKVKETTNVSKVSQTKLPDGMAEFKASIDGNLLRGWVEAIHCLVDECKVVVSKNGFEVKAVDPAHVCMMETSLLKKSFRKLTVKHNGELGLDLDKMIEVLQAVKSGDEVVMETENTSEPVGTEGDVEWSQKVKVSIRTITRRFDAVNHSCISDPKVPNLTMEGKFTMPFDMWEEAIKQARNVSDHVIIEMDSKDMVLRINADSGCSDDLTNEIPYGMLDGPVTGRSKDMQALYPEDYLTTTIKQGKVGMKRLLKGSKLTFRFNHDYPIWIEASRKQHWSLKYLLAPRIESD